jgi:glutaredoxin-like protein NrdH
MQVTVYTTPSCPQCEITKKVLTKGMVNYNVVDLSKDETAMEMVRGLGYASAPVVVAGDQHWSGFRHSNLSNLVKQIHSVSAKEAAAA